MSYLVNEGPFLAGWAWELGMAGDVGWAWELGMAGDVGFAGDVDLAGDVGLTMVAGS